MGRGRAAGGAVGGGGGLLWREGHTELLLCSVSLLYLRTKQDEEEKRRERKERKKGRKKRKKFLNLEIFKK
jgi:hypothetical protein